MKTQSWLWPDKVIYKRESRRLREEHNKLVNEHSELLDTLSKILPHIDKIDSENANMSKRDLEVFWDLCNKFKER